MSKKNKVNPAVQAILDRSADAESVAWAFEGAGSLAGLPDPLAAIDAAAALGNASALRAAADAAATKDLRKAAAAAIHRLKARGVQVEETVAPVIFRLEAEAVDIPSRAFLRLPSASGEVEVLLTTADASGCCVLGVLFGGLDGVAEVQHAHVTRSGLRNTWKEAGGEEREIPFAAGLKLAKDALAPRRDHGWTHFLEHITPAQLAAADAVDLLTTAGTAAVEEPEDVNYAPAFAIPLGLVDAEGRQKAVASLLEKMFSIYDANPEANAIDELGDTAWDDATDHLLSAASRPRIAAHLERMGIAFGQRGLLRGRAQLFAAAEKVKGGAAGREVEILRTTLRRALAAQIAERLQGEQ